MIEQRKLMPEKLLGKLISLEDSLSAFVSMNEFRGAGVTVINRF